MKEKALQLISPQRELLAILAAVGAWAEETTDRTLERRDDLVNDKAEAPDH